MSEYIVKEVFAGSDGKLLSLYLEDTVSGTNISAIISRQSLNEHLKKIDAEIS